MMNDSINAGSRAAHDLRNALAPIYAYAQLLEAALIEHHMEKETKMTLAICTSVKKMELTIKQTFEEESLPTS